jgi:TolB-like protein
MDSVKNLGIRNFENRSGTSAGSQVANYLSDKAKQGIQATGKFNIVASNDPNADGVFFGEVKNIQSKDSTNKNEYKDKNGNITVTYTYTRDVSVEFVYGVNSARTNMPFGTITKKGSKSSSGESSSDLASTYDLAVSIVNSQMGSLEKDLVPTFVYNKRELMKETSKDKIVKQKMKDAQTLVKNGYQREALRVYEEIADEYGSIAAMTNAKILREAFDSAAAADAQMASIDSRRTGITDKAVQSAVDTLYTKLPSGSVIIIMKSNSTDIRLLNDVMDELTKSVVQSGKLKVIDRSNQTIIDAEQQFQLSGNVDDNSAVSIGHQLGAKYIVFCWISGQSSRRRLNVKMLDIETSQITDQTDFEI